MTHERVFGAVTAASLPIPEMGYSAIAQQKLKIAQQDYEARYGKAKG
jgi:hypothetical protein